MSTNRRYKFVFKQLSPHKAVGYAVFVKGKHTRHFLGYVRENAREKWEYRAWMHKLWYDSSPKRKGAAQKLLNYIEDRLV